MVGAPKEMQAVITGLLKALVCWPFLRHKFKFLIRNINRGDLIMVGEFITTGKVTPVIDRRYPLAETAEAMAYVEDGHARAKVLITFQWSRIPPLSLASAALTGATGIESW